MFRRLSLRVGRSSQATNAATERKSFTPQTQKSGHSPASGWRIILPDSRFMIEAAHLIPFSVSYDDDPRNGIALAPSYHWALDAHVISPGPDFKWHVSDSLDRRIPDNKPLLELAGTELLLPKDKSCWPRLDALEWRFEHLLSLDSQ